MRRREFLALVAGAAALRPLGGTAQAAARLPTIGFLGAASAQGWTAWVEAFEQRLHELGWIRGRSIAIVYRWAEGREERYTEITGEFVRLKVDVIVTVGGAVAAAKRVTSVIPIVFAVANDPVGGGLVASLARPGGNVTGISNQGNDLTGKQVELLRDVVPGLRRLAVLVNADYPSAVLQRDGVRDAARTLGLELTTLEIRRAEDIAPAMETLSGRADALYVCSDPLVNTHRFRVNALALAARLATVSGVREYVEADGLISYGPDFPHLWRRAGEYVDKILKGAKPADLPVQQPTRFELVINLKTANALGLAVPASLLARADEVIE